MHTQKGHHPMGSGTITLGSGIIMPGSGMQQREAQGLRDPPLPQASGT